MSEQAEGTSTRRQLLAGAAGAAAAIVATQAIKADEAQAADGDNLKLGNGLTNTSSTTTTLACDGTDINALLVTAAGAGIAIKATSSTGQAIRGEGGLGVRGVGLGSGAFGVFGEVTTPGSTGVMGGNGSTSGQGVWAWADSGADAIFAQNDSVGNAVRVSGKVALSRSGTATVRKGKTSVKVTGTAVDDTTRAIATLQQHRKGVGVAAAVPNATTDTITIYLTAPAPSATKVTWMLLD